MSHAATSRGQEQSVEEWVAVGFSDQVRFARISGVGGGVGTLELTTRCGQAECAWEVKPLFRLGDSSHPVRFSASWDPPTSRFATIELAGDILNITIDEIAENAQSRRSESRLIRSLGRQLLEAGIQRNAIVNRRVKLAYESEFAEAVPIPAIYFDPDTHGCRSPGRIISTAFLKESSNTSLLLGLVFDQDGRAVKKIRRRVLTPAGSFRVLTILARYAGTVGERGMDRWKKAQLEINQDHIAFARQHGLRQPIVAFQNMNFEVPVGAIADPKNPEAVSNALRNSAISKEAFDMVVYIDIDPLTVVGGHSDLRDKLIYVGNSHGWKTELTQADWHNVANTVYHHEFGHQWGWEHDWTLKCSNEPLPFAPFVAPPVLFGWEDVDGNGVPEILEATGYGRKN